MDQGVAAVLAACVAGVSGTVGAAVGTRASGRAAQQQAEHDHALQIGRILAAEIQTTCEAYHNKGLAALQAALDFQTSVCAGRDGASEETEFSRAFQIFMMGAYDVGMCRLELEEPASQWYVQLQKFADALRTVRTDPATATDPNSPGRQQLRAAWDEQTAARRTFLARVQNARLIVRPPRDTP